MFAHIEISYKVRGPSRSENARHLVAWIYRGSKFCTRFERMIHSVCADFARRKLLFLRHYNIPCAHPSKRQACVRTSLIRVKDLTTICNSTRNQAGILTREFPLESPS